MYYNLAQYITRNDSGDAVLTLTVRMLHNLIIAHTAAHSGGDHDVFVYELCDALLEVVAGPLDEGELCEWFDNMTSDTDPVPWSDMSVKVRAAIVAEHPDQATKYAFRGYSRARYVADKLDDGMLVGWSWDLAEPVLRARGLIT